MIPQTWDELNRPVYAPPDITEMSTGNSHMSVMVWIGKNPFRFYMTGDNPDFLSIVRNEVNRLRKGLPIRYQSHLTTLRATVSFISVNLDKPIMEVK